MESIASVITFIGQSTVMKGLLSIASTIFFALFGTPGIAFQAFVILIIGDLIAKVVRIAYDNGGFRNALRKGKYRSRIASDRTLYKLFRYGMTVIVMHQMSLIVPIELMYHGYTVRFLIDTAAYLYVSWCELISIFETLVGIDGEDIKPLSDAVKKSRTRLTDKVLDSVLDRIAIKINERNKGEDKK